MAVIGRGIPASHMGRSTHEIESSSWDRSDSTTDTEPTLLWTNSSLSCFSCGLLLLWSIAPLSCFFAGPPFRWQARSFLGYRLRLSGLLWTTSLLWALLLLQYPTLLWAALSMNEPFSKLHFSEIHLLWVATSTASSLSPPFSEILSPTSSLNYCTSSSMYPFSGPNRETCKLDRRFTALFSALLRALCMCCLVKPSQTEVVPQLFLAAVLEQSLRPQKHTVSPCGPVSYKSRKFVRFLLAKQ